jgi:hypothetical protein
MNGCSKKTYHKDKSEKYGERGANRHGGDKDYKTNTNKILIRGATDTEMQRCSDTLRTSHRHIDGIPYFFSTVERWGVSRVWIIALFFGIISIHTISIMPIDRPVSIVINTIGTRRI